MWFQSHSNADLGQTRLIASETPCTYGIEIKADYVSGDLDRG